MPVTRDNLRALEDFLSGIKDYKRILETPRGGVPLTIGIGPSAVTIGSRELGGYSDDSRQRLQQQYYVLKPLIDELGPGFDYKPPFVNYFINYNPFAVALGTNNPPEGRLVALSFCIDSVMQVIGEVKGGAAEPKSAVIERGAYFPPKAFIAHGVQTKALERLCEFLRALGVEPIVVEK